MTGKQLLIYIGAGILILTLCFGVVIIVNKRDTKNYNASEKTAEKKELTIAAFGDSLTAGYGVDLTESYPYLLEQALREEGLSVTIINMGVSGETTEGGKERVSFVLEQNPDIILLGLGANDMLRSLPPSLAKANLDFIINEFVNANKKVIVLGMRSSVTNGQVYRQEFDAIYEDLAEKYNLPLVPFFLEGVVLRPSLNTEDGIHPNKAGYEKIVEENILPIVLPYLKKLK